MKIRTKLRANERRQDRAHLAAPQLFPLQGDGPAALTLTEMLRPGYRGPDSYLGRNKRGQWDSISLMPTRETLVAARYRDWLDARDAAIVAPSPRRRTGYEVTPADEARAAMAGRSAAAAYLAGSSLG